MKESCRDLNHIRNILIDVLTPLVLLPLPLTGRYVRPIFLTFIVFSSVPARRTQSTAVTYN